MVLCAQAPPEPDGCHLHLAHADRRREVCTNLHELQHDQVHAAMEASSAAWQPIWCRLEIMQDLQQRSWQDGH